MTLEVDAIIAVHRWSGAPGVVTDINSPGAHTPWDPKHKKFGAHYEPATPSATGEVSVAVDFGGADGPLPDEQALQVAAVFEPHGKAGKLSELYCGQSDYCVHGGKWMRWTSLPKAVRDAIRPAHFNHVHVATRPGVFLVPSAQPEQPQPEEEDLPKYIDKFVWPNGDQLQVFPDNHHECFGAKSYGNMNDLRDDAKQGFVEVHAVGPINPADSQAGYIFYAQNGNAYRFEPGVEKFFK